MSIDCLFYVHLYLGKYRKNLFLLKGIIFMPSFFQSSTIPCSSIRIISWLSFLNPTIQTVKYLSSRACGMFVMVSVILAQEAKSWSNSGQHFFQLPLWWNYDRTVMPGPPGSLHQLKTLWCQCRRAFFHYLAYRNINLHHLVLGK